MNAITLRLNPKAPEPLYEQIYAHIKEEIISGNYPEGTKLPSKRELSTHLQCSQTRWQRLTASCQRKDIC